MPFGIPMVWREPQNHYDDYHFCLCNVSGYNKKNKAGIKYPHLSSVIRPMPHGPDESIAAPPVQLEDVESSNSSEPTANDDVDFSPDNEDRIPQLFTQIELKLGSKSKEKYLLAPGTTFYWFRNREKEFRIFLRMKGQLVFCCDILALIHQLEEETYAPSN
jgi:hypothetical protein